MSPDTIEKGERLLSKLKPFERNPRIMPDHDMERLKQSIEKFGFVEPVVIDEKNNIRGGHQRVEAAKALGIKKGPVMVVSGLTEDEKVALNLGLNRIHGDWDVFLLTDLLQEIKVDPINIELTGFTDDEISLYLEDLPDLIRESIDTHDTEARNKDRFLLFRHVDRAEAAFAD